MLSRAVVLSKAHVKVYKKGIASSSKSFKGIAIGGQASGSESSTPSIRSSLAALKKEVEQSLSAVPQEEEQSNHANLSIDQGGAESDQNSSNSPATQIFSRRSQIDDAVQIPASSDRATQIGSPSLSSGKAKEESGRRNPFATKNRLTQREDDGWGPGLRAKIEEAQKTEQDSQLGGQSQIDAASIVTNVSEQSYVREQKPRATRSLGKWLPFEPLFEEFKGIDGRRCTEEGFEDWQIHTKRYESGAKTNLMSRRLHLPVPDLPLTLSSIISVLIRSKAVPKSLIFRDEGTRVAGSTILQIELGGNHHERNAIHTSTPKGLFPFKQYPGIRQGDAKAARMIDAILKVEEEINIRLQADGRTASHTARPDEQESAKFTRKDNAIDDGDAAQRRIGPVRQANSFEKTGDSRQGDAATSNNSIRRNQSRRPEQSSHSDTDRYDVERGRRQDAMKSSLPDKGRWSSMYSGLYGRSKTANTSSSTSEKGASVSVRGKNGRDERPRQSSWSPVLSSATSANKNIDSSAEARAKSSQIEESTPVHMDGKQAQGTAITSGSETSIKMAQERQGGRTEEAEIVINGPSSDDRIEDNTPVYVDSEQANETAIARDADSDSSDGAKLPGGAKISSSDTLEESTPVYVDDQQASGTATTSALITPTSGAREAVRSANEEQTETKVEEQPTLDEGLTFKEKKNIDESTPVQIDSTQLESSTESSKSSNTENIPDQSLPASGEPVEASTPVFVDDKQASGISTSPSTSTSTPTSTTGARETVKSANEAQDGQSDIPSTNSVDDSTPVLVDSTQAEETASTSGSDQTGQIAQEGQEASSDESNVSSKAVDDSVPVVVEGDQLGKKE